MAIGTDFEIQNDKDIRYIGSSANYTVLELHRWLQDLADNASSSGDDFMDITRETPSDKSFDTIINLINGYNIDDATAQHLYGGSIIQDGGNTIYDGIQVLAPAGMYLDIIQNGSLVTPNFWTTGLNADSANKISHQFMVKVRSGGIDIDGRRLLGITREWGKTYLEFKINGTSRGVNVMAFTGWADDLNNATLLATVAAYTGITNQNQGYNGLDVNNDSVNEFYYSKWTRASYTINNFYERMKYITRRGTSDTLYGLSGYLFRGITHEINVNTPTGTFNAFEPVSWSGGTGQMLAINSPTAPTKMWIQLLTGVAPTNTQTITGGTSSATCQVNTTVTERTVSTPFCGASTGTSLIGSFGFGMLVSDLLAADTLFDLTNTPYHSPNYVTFTVAGLVSGDYVLVAPDNSGTIKFDQFTLNGALNGAAVTAVVVNEVIPVDTPTTGTIRIQRADGSYSKHAYTAYNSGTKTFTIGSHNFSTNPANNAANCFCSYIDKVAVSATESYTAIYSGTPRNLFIRVRNGGGSPIKTFESTGTLGTAGGSATAVRTSDS